MEHGLGEDLRAGRRRPLPGSGTGAVLATFTSPGAPDAPAAERGFASDAEPTATGLADGTRAAPGTAPPLPTEEGGAGSGFGAVAAIFASGAVGAGFVSAGAAFGSVAARVRGGLGGGAADAGVGADAPTVGAGFGSVAVRVGFGGGAADGGVGADATTFGAGFGSPVIAGVGAAFGSAGASVGAGFGVGGSAVGLFGGMVEAIGAGRGSGNATAWVGALVATSGRMSAAGTDPVTSGFASAAAGAVLDSAPFWAPVRRRRGELPQAHRPQCERMPRASPFALWALPLPLALLFPLREPALPPRSAASGM